MGSSKCHTKFEQLDEMVTEAAKSALEVAAAELARVTEQKAQTETA
jgi:hypothetical protein